MRFRTHDLIRQARFDEAIQQLNRQIKAGEIGPDSFRFLGFCHFRNNQNAMANKWLRASLIVQPDDKQSWLILAKLNVEHSTQYRKHALLLAPDISELWFEQGVQDEINEKLNEGFKSYQRALICKPEGTDAYTNLSMLSLQLGKERLARRVSQTGLCLAPSALKLRNNSGLIHLSTEHFDIGWRDYAYRRKPEFPLLNPDGLEVAEWSGESLYDRTVALFGEQGIGDQFMFLSLLPEALKRSRDVILVLGDRLINVVRLGLPDITIVAESSLDIKPTLPNAVDFKLALGDLPRALGLFTHANFLPSPWLKVPDNLRATYRQKLEAHFPNAKRFIGLSWKTDSAKQAGEKSIPPALWGPLFQQPNTVFVDLQYGSTAEEVSHFSNLGPSPFFQDPELDRFNDFVGLSAMISSLDEVISVANLTPQLSGSIGIKIHVLLPENPQWPWGRRNSKSRWHPNTLIYRKSETLPSWKSILDVVAQDLHNSTS